MISSLKISAHSNAGGGGEAVLWQAIKATQDRWPQAICVVYTGDAASKPEILEHVKVRQYISFYLVTGADRFQKLFNTNLDSSRIFFLYLSTRQYVESCKYPYFTLLGQSLGSLVVAYDAFSLLVPDIFIDTMGYAFTLAFSTIMFPEVATGAYVHYPTISTDMLESLDANDSKGMNAGQGQGLKGMLKRSYWKIFASMYCWAGRKIDVVMTNSSWTQNHIKALWGKRIRHARNRGQPTKLYPPVSVTEYQNYIDINEEAEARREPILLYISQFRPEKNHNLILRAFARMTHPEIGQSSKVISKARLTLLGSVRKSTEDEMMVYKLRLLAHELKITDRVDFLIGAPWKQKMDLLQRSWIGVNGMWNEHFGIGVVEYQAAGLICVVNNSGGPKQDIVVRYEGGRTGYHASTEEEYADAFHKVLGLSSKYRLEMRARARLSAQRFSEEKFSQGWVKEVEEMMRLQSLNRKCR